VGYQQFQSALVPGTVPYHGSSEVLINFSGFALQAREVWQWYHSRGWRGMRFDTVSYRLRGLVSIGGGYARAFGLA